MLDSNFPKEILVELRGDDFLIARITLTKLTRGYAAELELVQKNSRKVFKSLGMLMPFETADDAKEQALLKLSDTLLSYKNGSNK